MRVGLLVILLAAAALAGCADSPVVVAEEDAFDGLEAAATDTTGVIRGVVVDDTITPIDGVQVSIANSEKVTTTNADGAFVFSGLEPGTYFLSAERAGFEAVQAAATVEAGIDEPAVLKIQMVRDPTTIPYVLPYVYEAYIQCAVTAVIVGYNGPCPNEFLVNYGTDELTRTPEFAQTEMIWQSTQATGDWMDLMYSAPRAGLTLLYNYAEYEGPSPGVIQANRSLMEENDVIAGYPLQIRIFSTGMEGTDIGRDYGDPVDGDDCIDRPYLGQCMHGVGLTLEQSLDVYTHTFFNWDPGVDWQFSTDGPPVPPPA